jgi:hypothetical protein
MFCSLGSGAGISLLNIQLNLQEELKKIYTIQVCAYFDLLSAHLYLLLAVVQLKVDCPPASPSLLLAITHGHDPTHSIHPYIVSTIRSIVFHLFVFKVDKDTLQIEREREREREKERERIEREKEREKEREREAVLNNMAELTPFICPVSRVMRPF